MSTTTTPTPALATANSNNMNRNANNTRRNQATVTKTTNETKNAMNKTNNASNNESTTATTTTTTTTTNKENTTTSNNESTTAPTTSQEESTNSTLSQILRRHPSPIAHPQQQILLTCYIPPYKIGAVIGRQGKTILGLQRDASRKSSGTVRMSVGTSSEEESEPWTPVFIRGDPVGCIYAASSLWNLVEHEMDDVIMDIPIHKSRHANIIGRKGFTINSTSAEFNVRIYVPRSNQEDEDNTTTSDPVEQAKQRRKENICQLEGELANVENCLCKILTLVSPNETDHVEVAIPAPPQLIPKVDSRLRTISKKTNTTIQRREDEDETVFVINGRPETIDYAKNMLNDMIESCSSNQERKANTNIRKKNFKRSTNAGRGAGRGRGNTSGRGNQNNNAANNTPVPKN